MIEIKNFSDLSLEEAQTLIGKENAVRVFNPNTQSKTKFYNLNEFIQTKQAVIDFFKDMPNIPNDLPNRDMLIFSYVYTKLSHMIKYDEVAVKASMSTGYAREMAEHLLDNAANAYGGLVLNTALCSGYSDTLKVLLESQGIKCKEIGGGSRTRGEKGGAHAWNQVCLDGKWYNCDLTNDCDFIMEGLQAPFYLKSNDDFKRYEQYPPHNPDIVEYATDTISPEIQEELINNAKQMLEQEKQMKQERLAKEQQEKELQAKQEKFNKLPKFIQKVCLAVAPKKFAGMER